MDKTVIYYTSNKESENFEQKIREGIWLAKGDLPLISVSQKPIDFGENICVGDVGHTYFNAFRQLLIGCEKATTPYVVMAEADFLYPNKGYFDFIPTSPDTIYSYDNVWILYKNKNYFYRKIRTHGSLIYGREFLISILKEAFKGMPEWSKDRKGENSAPRDFYKPARKWADIHGENPIISIKTGDGMNPSTKLMNEPPRKSFGYWGYAAELKRKLWTP